MKHFADSHVHIRFTRYDEIHRMLDDLSTTGLTDVCLLPLPYRGAAENLAAVYWKTHYDKMNIRAFGGLHVTDRYAKIPYEILVDKLLDLGCDGIKIMNSPDSRRYRGEGLNAKSFEKMFALLEERGTPINIHVTDPETFWDEGRPYHDPSFPRTEQLYEEMFEVLDRYPGLHVVFAHFFFLSNKPEEAERVLEKYPNVRFDLTPGVEMYYNFDKNIEYWHDFFTRYSDRILFGTDSNTLKTCNKELVALVYRKLTESHDFFTQNCYGKDFVVRGLNLDADVVERICYRNYIDFVGEKKPVNTDKFYEYCERILHDIRANPVDEMYIAGGAFIPDLAKDPMQKNATDFCERALAERR
ncbi:MAG: hypothetical protein E7463_02320 [Ruminococcaceae bacterium]|nr:hypothetical protein [Oscillospiraceae bacterium]